jgi:PhnB protein
MNNPRHNHSSKNTITSIAPWLAVQGGARAIEFYKSAFKAVEVYHIESPDGEVVSRLSIDGAEFWLSDDPPAPGGGPIDLEGHRISVRMILTVSDPDLLFAQAIAAGATAVYPVSDDHGWRIGRLADPFGHHWEIGCPLSEE